MMTNEERIEKLRSLNEDNGWIFRESPRDHLEYFVANINGRIYSAVAAEYAANGWSNMDTWEDFDNKIVAYRPMFVPQFRIK